MLTKKEILTLFITFALLFGLGALIYLPIVQKQLAEKTQAKLVEAGYPDLSVSFRGQDATVSGAIKNEDDRQAVEAIVKDAAVPISFRRSGRNAVRVVDTSSLTAPETPTAVAQGLQGEPLVTIAAYNNVIRVDGSVAKDGEKQQLAEKLRAKYTGYKVDTTAVTVDYAHSHAVNAADVNALPRLSAVNKSFFAAGKLNGKWETFPGQTLNESKVEAALVNKFPKHDPRFDGLKALVAHRDKGRRPPRPAPSTAFTPPRTTTPAARPIPRPAVNTPKPAVVGLPKPATLPKPAITPPKPPVSIPKPTVSVPRPTVSVPKPTPPVVAAKPPTLPKPTPVIPPPNINNIVRTPSTPAIRTTPSTPSTPSTAVRPSTPAKPPVSINVVDPVPSVAVNPIPPTFVPPKPSVPSSVVRPPTRPPVVRTTPARPAVKPPVATTVARAPASQLVGRLTFETGKSTLSSEKMNYGLRLVKNMLARRPNAIIQVIGHTDNVGAADANRKISRDRAAAVRDFLVSNGVKKQKILFTGKGEAEPIADNNTADGRGKNRRVDIIARY